MTEHEASRTLVKSPPELWAECSEAASLARHLGQFGEIRITKLEPETAVAWEGEDVSGTVRLEPSGWGTKVILTARGAEQLQTPALSDPPPVEDPPTAEEPQPAEEPPATSGEPQPVEEPPSSGGPQPVEEPPDEDPPPPSEPESEPEPLPPAASAQPAAEPPRKRGLMARLMSLLQPPAPPPTASTPPTASPPTTASTPPPQPRPAAAPWPAADPPRSATPPDLPGPPDPPEPSEPPDPPDPVVAGTVDHTAVLSAALDSLGQAHHRPFSRG
jgi:hypothetical protein